MTSASRRFLIRDRTSPSHTSVEAAVGSFETLEAYRRYLYGTYIFRAALDERMVDVRFPDAMALWSSPDGLSDLIRLDMSDLGMEAAKSSPSGQLPVIESDLESLLGTLYVVEGSSLGARVLYRRAQTLGLTEVFGARHLAAQARSVERWKRLLELLETAPELDLDRTVQASEATFAAVGRAFEDLPHV